MISIFQYTKRLEQVGFSRKQAETQLEIIGEMFTENMATKQDLVMLEASLRTDMHQLKNQLLVMLGAFFAFGFTSMTVLLKFWLIK